MKGRKARSAEEEEAKQHAARQRRNLATRKRQEEIRQATLQRTLNKGTSTRLQLEEEKDRRVSGETVNFLFLQLGNKGRGEEKTEKVSL